MNNNIYSKILSVILHPIAILVYFVFMMLTCTILSYYIINPSTGRQFLFYIIIVMLVLPILLLLLVKLRKEASLLAFKNKNSKTLLTFTVYFTIVAIFAHTSNVFMSLIQILPAILSTTMLIVNELKGIDTPISSISAFVVIMLILGIILNVNLLVPILVFIILSGFLMGNHLENETIDVKTLIISVIFGIFVAIVSFIFALFL